MNEQKETTAEAMASKNVIVNLYDSRLREIKLNQKLGVKGVR